MIGIPQLALPRGRAQAVTAGGAPMPSPTRERLMGSRFNQMGFAGYAGSDGVDTDSNTRIGSYNESGATVTRVRAVFCNWRADAANEQDGYDPITVTASIEYPAGAFNQVTFNGGSVSASIPASGSGSTVVSDEVALATPVPAGAVYWIRTHVSVAAGQKWVQGYLIDPFGLDEAADFSTGVDRTMGGTIANTAATPSRRGYGPVAVKATTFAGTPVPRAFAAIGDSLVFGQGDFADPAASGHGNFGYFAKACAHNYPVVNLGFPNTQAQHNLPSDCPRRHALMAAAGITHVFCNWSVNDLTAGRTAAQLAADAGSIAAGFKSAVAGVRVVYATIVSRTTSIDGWKTAAGQAVRTSPAGAFDGGASSQRSLFNAALRSGLAGVDVVFDAADALEVNSANLFERDAGLWISGNAGLGESSVHLTTDGSNSDRATADGLHPVTNNSAGALGGVYILRDAVRAVFHDW